MTWGVVTKLFRRALEVNPNLEWWHPVGMHLTRSPLPRLHNHLEDLIPETLHEISTLSTDQQDLDSPDDPYGHLFFLPGGLNSFTPHRMIVTVNLPLPGSDIRLTSYMRDLSPQVADVLLPPSSAQRKPPDDLWV